MEKRRFGRTGYEVSVVGFGGAPIGYLETQQQQVARILNTLLDEGVNVIDTAAAYQGSEQAIGQAVARRRDAYVLVSKCGEPGNPDHARANLAAADHGQLRQAAFQRIRDAFRNAESESGEQWKGLT